MLFATVLVAVGASAFADSSDVLNTYLASGRVVKIESNCPAGAKCIVNLYVAELLLNLKGCADRVVSVTASPESAGVVLVNAVVAATRESLNARCIAAPTATAQITLVDPSANIQFVTNP